MTKDGNQIRL